MMKTLRKCLLSAVLLALIADASAGAINFSDYRLLTTGMSEAEVLYRVGKSDHEVIVYGPYHSIHKKIWYYIPDGSYSGDWLTEIVFDRHGRIIAIERTRPKL